MVVTYFTNVITIMAPKPKEKVTLMITVYKVRRCWKIRSNQRLELVCRILTQKNRQLRKKLVTLF